MSMKSNRRLIEQLGSEREKYTRSDPILMRSLCDQLVEMGVYPAKSGIGLTPLTMVENWGIDWNEYREPLQCKECGYDLRDLKNGPPFKLEIAITYLGQDKTVFYMCPKCEKNIQGV